MTRRDLFRRLVGAAVSARVAAPRVPALLLPGERVLNPYPVLSADPAIRWLQQIMILEEQRILRARAGIRSSPIAAVARPTTR